MSRIELKVLENRMIADDLYNMILKDPGTIKDAIPGQFLHIKIPGNESLLMRRPFSINDVEPGKVHLVYQVVGKGTRVLARLKPGVYLDVLGPLGNGFHVPKGSETIYIVGGGCGVAPMKFVGKRWGSLSINSFLGFRTKTSSYQISDFKDFSERLYIATDDGSLGEKGTITKVLDNELSKKRPDLILGCGPLPMLKALKGIAATHGIPCQLSLEERMGCGLGGCLVCACAVGKENNGEYKRVCADGPVFWSEEVNLDGWS